MVAYGYDATSSVYSPEGKLYQLEYARKIIENDSSLLLAVCCSDGVVICAERFGESILLENDANQVCFKPTKNISLSFTGRWPDGKYLCTKAVNMACEHLDEKGFDILPITLVKDLSLHIYSHTLGSAHRIYGAECFVSAFHQNKPCIFHISQDGSVVKVFGHAIGKGADQAIPSIETLDLTQSIDDLLPSIAKIVFNVHEETFMDKKLRFEVTKVYADRIVSLSERECESLVDLVSENAIEAE
ncbi:MAG: putative proteasome subunit alpha type-7 [Marteilia pararefringens]